MRLFTDAQLQAGKYRDVFPVTCEFCGKAFLATKRELVRSKPYKGGRFCGNKCSVNYTRPSNKTTVVCTQCGKQFSRYKLEVGERNYCNRSCRAKYQNAHKVGGVRRSKLERFLEKCIRNTFPSLRIQTNCRSGPPYELDIYIPDIGLAIELNGPTHYEPIYGFEKWISVQQKDAVKHLWCLDNNIKLLLFDVRDVLPKHYKSIFESIVQEIGYRMVSSESRVEAS